MSEFQVKLTQPGFDVNSTPDLNLIFSDKTNPLKTQKDILYGSVKLILTPANQFSTFNLCTHNLGYKPAFAIFKIRETSVNYYDRNTSGDSWQGPQDVDNNTPTRYWGDRWSTFRTNSQTLYFKRKEVVVGGAKAGREYKWDSYEIELFYMIFRTQIDKRVDYPVEAGGQSEPLFNTQNGTGIEMSRTGFDVNSCGPDDLLFSSRYPTFSVVKVDSPGASGDVYHNLGYIPFFMAFCRRTDSDDFTLLANNMTGAFVVESSGEWVTATDKKITITTAASSTVGFNTINESWVVILRDYI